MRKHALWIIVALALLAGTGPPALGLTLQLGFPDPATGQPAVLTLPDDPGEALRALRSGIGEVADQVGAAIDNVVPNVTGCLTDPNGRPVFGAIVFLLKAGVPPSVVYGTTAGSTTLQPPLFTSIVGAGVIPAPVPVPLRDGCYWIPIPIDLLDPVMNLMAAAGSATGALPDQEVSLFFLYPVVVGQALDPPAYEVAGRSNGTFRLKPLRSPAEITLIQQMLRSVESNLPGGAQ